MKSIRTVAQATFGIAIGVWLLAGCSAGTSSTVAFGGSGNRTASRGTVGAGTRPAFLTAARGAVHTAKDGQKSWLKPGVNQNRLLYISDYNNGVVQVYNYPSD